MLVFNGATEPSGQYDAADAQPFAAVSKPVPFGQKYPGRQASVHAEDRPNDVL